MFICGKPITVKSTATEEELEEKRKELEETLIEITRRADRYFDR